MKPLIPLTVIFITFSAFFAVRAQNNGQFDDSDLTEEQIARLRVKKISGLRVGTVSPNELAGYKFFLTGKLKSLRLGVSGRAEVVKIFGKSCEEICEYDADWKIVFEYFDDLDSYWIQPDGGKTKWQKMVILPETVGKISRVILSPTNRISFSRVKFSNEFYKYSGVLTGESAGGKSTSATLDSYLDGYGLKYILIGKINYSDREEIKIRQDGDLAFIEYQIPPSLIKSRLHCSIQFSLSKKAKPNNSDFLNSNERNVGII